MIIDLNQLDDRAAYCVIRDEANRESIIVNGRLVKTHAEDSPDFKRFSQREIIALPGYARVRVHDDCFLGVWLDPWRPELRGGDVAHPEPTRVSAVNATPRPSVAGKWNSWIVDELKTCTGLLSLCSLPQ